MTESLGCSSDSLKDSSKEIDSSKGHNSAKKSLKQTSKDVPNSMANDLSQLSFDSNLTGSAVGGSNGD